MITFTNALKIIKNGTIYTLRLFTYVISLGKYGFPKAKESKTTIVNNQPLQKRAIKTLKAKEIKIESLEKSLKTIQEKLGQDVGEGFSRIASKFENNPELKPILEKLIFLGLKKNPKVKSLLSQIIENIDIKKIEDELSALINGEIDKIVDSVKEIEDPEIFKIERSRKVAEILISELGELNLFLIDQIKEKLPKSVSDCYEEDFNEKLDTLKNNSLISSLLTSINTSKDPRNKANQFIRATLKLSFEQAITPTDVRRGVLSALLMDLRQAGTGSCFTTGVAIRIHNTQPERFLQDMKNLIENGYIERSFNGKKSQFTWSSIPVEEIGFNSELEDNNGRILAALQALGIPSDKAATKEIEKQIYLENNRLFQFEGRLLEYQGKPVSSFADLITMLLEDPNIQKSSKVLELLEKMKKQEDITSLQAFVEVLTRKMNKLLAPEIVSKLSEQELEGCINCLKIITGLKENNRRFTYQGKLFNHHGIPICSFEGLIEKLLTHAKVKKSEQLIVILLKIKKEENITSLEMLIRKVTEYSGSSIENVLSGQELENHLFDFLDLVTNLKEIQREFSTIKNAIESLAMQKAGITEEDIQDRQKMIELSNTINTLSTQKLINSKINIEINQKIDEYIKIAKRITHAEQKLFHFDKLMDYAKICYASTNHNLLLRGWEYGLAGTGKKQMICSKVTPQLISMEAAFVYESLFGESPSAKPTLGIDQKLTSLISNNETLLSLMVQDPKGKGKQVLYKNELIRKLNFTFLLHFEKLFSERVKLQYQYGGYALYDATGPSNLNEIQFLFNLDQLQKMLGGLILETGVEIAKEIDIRYARAMTGIIDELSQYATSQDFFEYFVRKIANAYKETIKPSDKIPENVNLSEIFKNTIEGGNEKSVLETYYESTGIKTIRMIPQNAQDLLIKLIATIKSLNVPKDKKLRMPISGNQHAFLLMPNHDSFRSAIDSDLSPEEWVKKHLIDQNEKIVFADSNWESLGLRRFFVFAKNETGEVFFDCIDEKGNPLGGINEMGIAQKSMDQNEWVNNKIWDLHIV